MAKQSEFGKYVTWAQLQRVVALAIEAAIEVSADRGPLHCLDGSIETVLDEKPKPTIRSEARLYRRWKGSRGATIHITRDEQAEAEARLGRAYMALRAYGWTQRSGYWVTRFPDDRSDAENACLEAMFIAVKALEDADD